MPTITPVAGPRPVEGHMADTQNKAAEARARAIARLTGAPPSLNQTQVSPEERTAVSPEPAAQAEAPAQAAAAEGQPATSEDPASPSEPSKEATSAAEAPLSSQYAQLARKEKAIRAQAQELKQREAAFKAREEAIKAKEAEMMDRYVPKERLAKDPWSVLNENNISYEQLTQEALNAPSPEARAQQQMIAELKAEIQALKDGQDSTKKSIEESQKNAYTQAVNQIRNDAKALVAKDDAFETIRATESHEDVVELITKTFETEGVLLTVEEAAQAVEDYLVEEAMKVAKLKKIQERLKPQAAASGAAPSKDGAPRQQQPMKTLTNAHGTSRQLSAKERAVLAFKGELKS